VIYPAALVPSRWRMLIALNPMVGYIDAFRAACLGRPIDFVTFGIAVLVTGGFLALATRTFRSVEQTFAEYI
jgi:ABC-type polysaccharide/polyol phosphate export permease